MKRKTWVGTGIGVAVLVGASWWGTHRPAAEIQWRLAKISEGNITQRINATGAVSPVVQVAVGTQVSGVISALYVDYNSIVKKGQLIAQIDPTIWESQLMDAKASLQRAQAAYDFAKSDYNRSKKLWDEKLLADSDLDTKDVALKNAQGNLVSAQASLDHAKANLDYCNITAPVDGVVISRLADVGQTVAASFSTPNLFMIAQDLSQMQVQVNIGESDIDDVKAGQNAFFTVDSLPDKQFRATVSRVRQEPITNNNVVTYVVEMIVPNEPLPGAEEPSAVKPSGASRPVEGDRSKEGGSGAPDPEKAWARMKDRLPAGTTKAEFLKRFQERMAEHKPIVAIHVAKMDPQLLAHIPGGASQLPGPKFTGNLALRSGMTANVTITTNQRRDVLRVPNAALRFNPAAFVKDDKKSEGPRLGQPMMFGGGRPRSGAQAGTAVRGGVMAKPDDHVWVLENGTPKPLVVKVGATDGQFSEVTGEGIQEGLQVLIGVESAKQSGSSAPGSTGGPGGGRR